MLCNTCTKYWRTFHVAVWVQVWLGCGFEEQQSISVTARRQTCQYLSHMWDHCWIPPCAVMYSRWSVWWQGRAACVCVSVNLSSFFSCCDFFFPSVTFIFYHPRLFFYPLSLTGLFLPSILHTPLLHLPISHCPSLISHTLIFLWWDSGILHRIWLWLGAGLYQQIPLCTGGVSWQIPLMPCQFLCQTRTHAHIHTHISDYQAKPDKWGAYRTAGEAWHSSTPRGSSTPPPPSMFSAQWGVSTHTHTHSIHPLQKKQLLYCVSVLFFFFSLSQLSQWRQEHCDCAELSL